MFDNTTQPSPSAWSSIRDHLPLALLVAGVAGLAIGLHTALTAVAVLAAAHVVGAALLFALAYVRRSRSVGR